MVFHTIDAYNFFFCERCFDAGDDGITTMAKPKNRVATTKKGSMSPFYPLRSLIIQHL